MPNLDNMPSLIGKVLGQYEIIEEIGRGGMATVFKARQSSIDRYVAIKVLPSQFTYDSSFVKRFEREAKAIAGLEHPHILPLYDFGTQDGLTYMVMRYIKGGDLSNLMGQELSNERIVEIIANIARALDYAHKKGIVHRDIKPSNILIDENDEVLLTDFGIAKVENSKLTEAGAIVGTPEYIAPEQLEGIADGRSDIYALGVVLYELLTGYPPYYAKTPLATAFKHVIEEFPLPRTINPNVDQSLEQVVIKAMAKDPNERYQTGREMEQALKAALGEISGSATTIYHVAPTTQANKQPDIAPLSMNARLIVGAIVILLILVVGGIAWLGRSSPADNEVAEGTSSAIEATDETETTSQSNKPAPITSPEDSNAEAGSVLDRLLEGDVLLKENFDSDRRGWFTGEFGDDDFGQYSARIVNDRYRLSWETLKSVSTREEPSESGDFDDFIVTVDAIPAAQSDPFGYGLTFRGTPDGDFYTFEVYNDGHFAVRLNNTTGWQVLVDTTPMAAIKNNEANQLAVQADGPILSFFINGQEATTIEDHTLEIGKIGVFITLEGEASSTVEFDNLVIRELSNNQ